ncbi:MAG: manganese efflux pump MntP family protein [Bacillota bacterium]
MTFYSLLLVAAALGADAFSMAVGLGLSGLRRRQLYLFAGAVALFHVLMPLTGLWLGSLLGKAIGRWAGYLGALVLVFIGLHMLKEGWTGPQAPLTGFQAAKKTFLGEKAPDLRVLTGAGAVLLLAGSVSVDALTVGFGLGVLKANLLLSVLTMGAVAGIMTVMGLFFGQRLGRWLGGKAQLLGGIVLIAIGLKMIL